VWRGFKRRQLFGYGSGWISLIGITFEEKEGWVTEEIVF